MTPRKASLRVAHTSKCALRQVVVKVREDGTNVYADPTALSTTGKGSGCTCKPSPSYYVSWQTPDGKTQKSARVKNKDEAEKTLNEKQVELDQGVSGYRQAKTTTLPEWAAEYQTILEGRNVKGETIRGYKDTMDAAVDAIGHLNLRHIGNRELRLFMERYKDAADATKIRRLKELSASLSTAQRESYLEQNPVPAFKDSLRLRAPKTASPPFEDGEIQRLLGALERPKVGKGEPVYAAIVNAAVLTGARVGELIALEWSDIDLLNGELTIKATYNPADGVTPPKDYETRVVYLTADAVTFFGKWKGTEKKEGLVFRSPRSGSYLDDDHTRKVVHTALSDAGIDLVNGKGIKRKPFHSLRATYTRRMLEQGKAPQWVQANLGHSDLRLTYEVYGQWTVDKMRAEAKG